MLLSLRFISKQDKNKGAYEEAFYQCMDSLEKKVKRR